MLERAAFVCCDSREQARLESGDLIEPVERGVLDWLEVHELQEVVAGEVQGRAVRRGHRRLQVERPRRVGRRGRRAALSSAPASAASAASSELVPARRRVSAIASSPTACTIFGSVEQARPLLRRCSGSDVRVLEDLGERPAAVVLADRRTRRRAPLSASAAKRNENGFRKRLLRLPTAAIVSSSREAPADAWAVRRARSAGTWTTPAPRSAIVIWIERKPGAVWAVGRAVNLGDRAERGAAARRLRSSRATSSRTRSRRRTTTLEDDLQRLGGRRRRAARCSPFTREELLKPLERWFFGREADSLGRRRRSRRGAT